MKNRPNKEIYSQERVADRPMPRGWEVGDLVEKRYEVFDVKAGGIGIVYIVYDHDHKVPYAIKTLQDRHLQNPAAVSSFTREAEVWVRIGRHHNIVRAVCVDQIGGRPSILLECIIGSDLREALSDGPLARRTALGYAIQFCRGMIHAQQKIPDFAHLDVKPENCLLTQDNTLKVTDFSLSKALFESTSTFCMGRRGQDKAGGAGGTLPYISPEQFIDVTKVGIQSDVYAFGVVLYEVLTGNRPFFAATPLQWREAHLHGVPARPRAINSSITKELDDLTMRCLAKDPIDRPQGFQVIMNTLEAMLWEEFREKVPPSTQAELESWEYSNVGVSLCNLGHQGEALACFDKALSKNPRNPHAWLNRGVAAGALDHVDEELECYEKALALVPDYREAWYNKGLALYKRGRFKRALACYDRALALDPQQADVWVNRGSVMGSLGRSKEEILCYEKALGIRPDHARAWVGKAAVLIHMGHFEEAVACSDKALAINPDLAEAWINKASATGALERYHETIRCCDKALGINPGLCEAWVSKGLALGRLGRRGEEVACYQEALEINPDHLEAWYRRGLTLCAVNRFEEAVRCYDRALSINSRDTEIWVEKGLALVRMAAVRQAVTCYDKALTIDPQHASAWYNKGLAFHKLGQGEAGDRCLRKAARLKATITSNPS